MKYENYEWCTYTYDDMTSIVDEEYAHMSIEETQMRAREVEPTFFEYVLSSMRPTDTVSIEYDEDAIATTNFRILNT